MYMPFAGNYDSLLSANEATMKMLKATFQKSYHQLKMKLKVSGAWKPLKWMEA